MWVEYSGPDTGKSEKLLSCMHEVIPEPKAAPEVPTPPYRKVDIYMEKGIQTPMAHGRSTKSI